MTMSMYQAFVPMTKTLLTALSAVLDKGAAYAEAKKVDPSVLLNWRLAPDMFALARQGGAPLWPGRAERARHRNYLR